MKESNKILNQYDSNGALKGVDSRTEETYLNTWQHYNRKQIKELIVNKRKVVCEQSVQVDLAVQSPEIEHKEVSISQKEEVKESHIEDEKKGEETKTLKRVIEEEKSEKESEAEESSPENLGMDSESDSEGELPEIVNED